MNIRYKEFGFLAVLALVIFVPTSVAFGVSGTIFSDSVSPGQKLVHVITVSSKGTEPPLNMTAEVCGFAKNLEGDNIQLSPENDKGPFTARPFLSIEPKSFHLEPGEHKTLNLTGTFPENAGPGGKYAIVTIATEPNVDKGISVSTAIQTAVLLTNKDSDLISTGKITDLIVSKSNEKVAINLTFENTGNIHYKPLAKIILRSENGKILAEGEVDQNKSKIILPTNSRLFEIDLIPETSLSTGTYIVEAKVNKDDGTVLDSKETTLEV